MRLSIERGALLKAVAQAQSVVERRNTIPILANVLIEADGNSVQFRATDLDIEVVDRAPAMVERAGSTTVSAVTLHEIVRKLPDGALVTLADDGTAGRLAVSAGRSNFNLATLPKEDFPVMANSEYAANFSAPAPVLRRLFDKSKFAISTEETRYYLNGVYFHVSDSDGARVLRAVATDGHRLARIDADLPEGAAGMPGVIVPRKTVLELQRLLSDKEGAIDMQFAGNQAKFSFDGMEFVTKLVEGKFPDYNRVIPRNHTNELILGRQTLLSSLQRTAIMTSDKFKGVRLNIEPGSLRVAASNAEQEEATDEIEIDYAGDAIEIGFNVTYLMDVLTNMSQDMVRFSLSDGNSSALITLPDSEDFKYVVMPMRI